MFGRKQEKIKRSINDISTNTENNRASKKQIKRLRIAQNVIRYNHMLENGICVLDDDLYSKAIQFTDINYQIAPDDTKMSLLRQYKNLLNSMGNNIDVSLVINNRLINKEEFERDIIMKHRGDGLDTIRGELNRHLLENMSKGNNSIISEKMFVYTCRENDYQEAVKTLSNLERDFEAQLYDLGCEPKPMTGEDRLRVLHSITKPGKSFNFSYDLLTPKSSTKDWISPYSFDFKKDSFEMDDRHCCVMILSNYPTWMGDQLIYDLTNIESNITIAFHMAIKSKEEALMEINKTSALVDMQVEDENRKSMNRMNFSGQLPHNLAVQVENLKDWRNAIEKGDERMFQTQLVVMINAASHDEMEHVKKDVQRIGKRNSCEFIVMELEQEIGFNAVLPLGLPKEGLGRNLLTDNCANIMPFTSQELLEDKNPIFYGINQTTNNMILCNRKTLSNANGFILGKTGAGKSFKTKQELTWLFLNNEDADIVIIDPQGEYRRVAECLNENSNKKQCSVLEISNTSELYFNPFEGDMMEKDFTRRKAEYIQVLMAEMLGNGYLIPEQKSIIDQIVFSIYQDYEENLKNGNFDKAIVPTLKTFYEYLETYDDPVAKSMYTALWTYVYGSYNMFSHESNVDSDSRMLIYDISELGETIRTLGLKVVLESVRELVLKNHKRNRLTYIYIDEIYLLLKDEYSENFLYEFWKWIRKFGGACTGMTQNVTDLLKSQKGSAMLSNSEFYIILAQDSMDLMQLKSLLNLSDEQVRYVQSARKGSGLIRFGKTIIPFADSFPKDTTCYSMWHTDPQIEIEKANEFKQLQEKAKEFQKNKKKELEESPNVVEPSTIFAENNEDRVFEAEKVEIPSDFFTNSFHTVPKNADLKYPIDSKSSGFENINPDEY